MANEAGTFIVLEGTDGSGKTTQYNYLRHQLEARGYKVTGLHFPLYNEPSSFFIREYLSGKYGTSNEVGPYTVSLFYALDRFQSARKIKDSLAAGDIVLCDRFVASNMAYQGVKFANIEQRRGFFIWLDNLEYEVLRMTRPTVTFILNADNQSNPGQTSSIPDEAAVNAVYLDLCHLFPKDFTRIDCVRNGQLLNPSEISKLLWEKIVPFLPQLHDHIDTEQLASTIVESSNVDTANYDKATPGKHPFIDGQDGHIRIFSNVFTNDQIGLALSLLSSQSIDPHAFISSIVDQTVTLDRQVARGESALRFDILQSIIENVSVYTSMVIGRGREAVISESAVVSDRMDRFVIPEPLDTKSREQFETSIVRIYQLHRKITERLQQFIPAHSSFTDTDIQDASISVLPLATKTTIGLCIDGLSFERLIHRLLSDSVKETQTIGNQFAQAARTVIPDVFKRSDAPTLNESLSHERAMQSTISEAFRELSPGNSPDVIRNIVLLNSWPRFETELLSDAYGTISNQPYELLRATINGWEFDKKAHVLRDYFSKALENSAQISAACQSISYTWELLSNTGLLRSILKESSIARIEYQPLTVRYGFETPKVIEAAGLSDEYDDCFTESLSLFSFLQEKGFEHEAQLAVLGGHLNRYRVTIDAVSLAKITKRATGEKKRLLRNMIEQIEPIHPIICEVIQSYISS